MSDDLRHEGSFGDLRAKLDEIGAGPVRRLVFPTEALKPKKKIRRICGKRACLVWYKTGPGRWKWDIYPK